MKDGPYTGPLLYFREKSLELIIYRLSKVSYNYSPCILTIKGLKNFLLINSLSSLFLVFFVQIKKGGKNIQFLPTKCLDSPTIIVSYTCSIEILQKVISPRILSVSANQAPKTSRSYMNIMNIH